MSARKRFSREDWLDFGLAQLAAEGPDALSIHPLCKAAGRTIGSFYHHFRDHAGFVDALLARWRKLNTEDVITAIDALDDPVERSERLNAIAIALNQPVELGIRLLAAQTKRATAAVAEVDKIRIGHLAGLHHAISGLEAELAMDMARLEYASFVGGQVIWREQATEYGPRLAALFESMARGYVERRSA